MSDKKHNDYSWGIKQMGVPTCMTREEYYSEEVRGDWAGHPVNWHPTRSKAKKSKGAQK
jgi:hypothetical protein